jgi:hypothetical protein
MPERGQRRGPTTIFDSKDLQDPSGCAAYDPKLGLKVMLFAYARGSLSSRTIEPACREKSVVMALACGAVPDHSTIAPFVAAMQDEMLAIFRDLVLVGAEED